MSRSGYGGGAGESTNNSEAIKIARERLQAVIRDIAVNLNEHNYATIKADLWNIIFELRAKTSGPSSTGLAAFQREKKCPHRSASKS
jgi:hypothetical protein